MKRILAVSTVVATCMTSEVLAQEDDGRLSFDGYVGAVSDLRDRGLSLSDRDPAIVGSFGVFSDSGFYGGVLGSSADDGRGADARAEFYAGYQFGDDAYIYDLSLELDSFHGNGSQFYPEIKASVARDFGLAFIRAGVSYAPDGRWVTPNNNSLYVSSDIEVPVPTMPDVTAIFRVGHDFRSDLTNVWDWGAGVSVFVKNVEFSVMYEDSGLKQDIGQGRVIFGARFYF